jgi:hypothetical protein
MMQAAEALAPAWWESFHFRLVDVLKENSFAHKCEKLTFGAIYEYVGIMSRISVYATHAMLMYLCVDIHALNFVCHTYLLKILGSSLYSLFLHFAFKDKFNQVHTLGGTCLISSMVTIL